VLEASRHEVLSGAVLAEYEYVGVGCSETAYHVLELEHLWRLADKLRHGVGGVERLHLMF